MSPGGSLAGSPGGSLAGSLAAALLATLARPAWWALALAGFLVRGGFLVVFLPLVQLPSVAGLANAVGPTLVGFVFGGPSVPFLVLVGTIALAAIAWLLAGGLLGGSLDLALIREAAAEEELEDRDAPRFGGARRAFALRAIAHGPTAAVLAWGAVRVVDAAYQELIRPGDPAIPVAVRVALRIPEIVALLAVAWGVGEAVGGAAVRHLAWGASVPRALGRAGRTLVRPSGVVTFVVTNASFGAVVLASATASGVAWDHLRVVLVDGGTGNEIRLALILFSLTWAGGLWLLALAAAWRATAWTFEVARHLPARTAEPSTL